MLREYFANFSKYDQKKLSVDKSSLPSKMSNLVVENDIGWNSEKGLNIIMIAGIGGIVIVVVVTVVVVNKNKKKNKQVITEKLLYSNE